MKRYFYLCLLTGKALTLSAQTPVASQPVRKLPISLGLRLGLNYTNTNFNEGQPKPVVPVATTWQTGLVAGAFVQVAITKKLAVAQEYLYAQMGGAVQGGAQYKLQYLSLPLLLKYAIVPRLAVVVGPQVDVLIKASETLSGQTTDITHDTEERSLGATAGLEVRLGQKISVDARYLQGLNHIGIGQRSAVQEFKFQAVQVAAGYRF